MRHALADRIISLRETVPAPLERVWEAWTTTGGVTSWLVDEADIELEINGKFEIYFAKDAPEGSRGGEGCTILSYSPRRMLSFTWNAPPTIPELRKLGPCTWVVLEFAADDESSTTISFKQFGIKSGLEWDKYLDYFQNAWPNVFAALKKHFSS